VKIQNPPVHPATVTGAGTPITVLAANDELTIVLVEPELADMPNSVIVHWPPVPTVSDPRAFPQLATGVVKLLAAAATKLAAIKSRRSL
jgi:hypothetical protein